jgi:hypothetical protein
MLAGRLVGVNAGLVSNELGETQRKKFIGVSSGDHGGQGRFSETFLHPTAREVFIQPNTDNLMFGVGAPSSWKISSSPTSPQPSISGRTTSWRRDK